MRSTSQVLASGQRTGHGLDRDLETITLAGAPTPAIGRDGDGESYGGRVVSLQTFPERGIVVAVLSNVSHADTSAMGLTIANAFAEGRGPARGR